MTTTRPKRIYLVNRYTPSYVAGVTAAMDYRLAVDRRTIDAISLALGLTFSRASTALRIGPDGAYELVDFNTPRFSHNQVTRQSQGLLLEATSTNLVNYSQTLSSVARPWSSSPTAEELWMAFESETLSSNMDGPFPGTKAAFLRETAALDKHQLSSTFNLVIGTSYCFSLFAKASTRRYVTLTGGGVLGSGNVPQFDLQTGQNLSTGSGITTFVEQFPNGWYRIGFTFTANIAAPHRISLFPTALTNPTGDDYIYQGNGTSGIFVWGAQVETSTQPTSPILTGAGPATRATESASISLTSVPAPRTLVEKPIGCASIVGDNVVLNTGFTAERIMIFPAALTSAQIASVRAVM